MLRSPLLKLQDLSSFLESQGSLDDNLRQLAEMAAKILNADHCSIMLLNEGEHGDIKLRVAADVGALPEAAYRESAAVGEGIAGHVVTSGKSLLIENIERSEFAAKARRIGDAHKSMLCSPIWINGKIIGVINVREPRHQEPFTQEDLNLLDVVAMFVGKSIQVVQLQNILHSRFTQLALAEGAGKTVGQMVLSAGQNPDQMARILAKSFYREMTKAGFGSTQIINASSEIISELSKSLQKHSKRISQP